MEIKDESKRWWDDEDFQDSLTALLIRDPTALRSCAPVLSAEDFRPLRGMFYGNERWVVIERALEHYEKHHEPLGRLLRSDVLEYASNLQMGENKLAKLKDYLTHINKLKLVSPDALTEKVIRFKSQHLKMAAIQELQELHSVGGLTDEKWNEISSKALKATFQGYQTTNYLQTVDHRVERRKWEARNGGGIPWTFIDPLDSMIRCVGRKQLGLIIAPYKRGKSLFLLWLAVAYALQRLNVLYITLEDPQTVVEDRLDSIVTYVPVKQLNEYPKTLKSRFERKRQLMAGIEIFDGTDESVSVPTIEQVYKAKRDEGFIADVIITDYDEEIKALQRYKDKRFESDEVYRSYRQMCSKYNAIGWLAAQTQRDTRSLKILTGDRVAEDIGKLKKVTCGLTLGKGEWTDNSFYLWVAAHKNDKMDCGVELVPDLDRMLVYDREATRREARAHPDMP